MTKEEVIKMATGLRTDFKCESETMVDFCNSIIEFVQEHPCEDCISRQAVLDCAITIETDDFSGNEVLSVVDVEEIKALPSTTPKYSDEEIDRAQAVEKAYVDKMVELSVNSVLDKIRAEVEDIPSCMLSTSSEFERGVNAMLGQSLMIIDKYRESVDN